MNIGQLQGLDQRATPTYEAVGGSFLPKEATQRSRDVVSPGHRANWESSAIVCYWPSKLVMRVRFPSPALDWSR